MIRATVDRLEGLVESQAILVVTNQRLVDPIREQLSSLPAESVLGEPCKRDTAPCVGLSAAWVARDDPDAIMLVMPADHVIKDRELFQHAVRQAMELVQENPRRLVTFGIKPTYPAESFGYIESGESLGDAAYRVQQFREKPKVEVAEKYLAAGGFYWNSGIFVWKASTILDLLGKYEPQMSSHLHTIAQAIGTSDFYEVLQTEFARIQGTSIDYAVMERADEVAVIEAPFDWDDVGSWTSLERLRGTDEHGNTTIGKTLPVETKGCILSSQGNHLIATVGVEHLIVVHTPDATLVADRRDEESVRKIVQLLQEQGYQEYL